MLRIPEGGPEHKMCIQCHPEAAMVEKSIHGNLSQLANLGRPAACAPCHTVHERTVDGDSVWSLPLGDAARCTSCHGGSGMARMPHFAPHPPLTMTNIVADGPGFMPLVDENGHPGRTGLIACITCHVPHGRMPGGGFQFPTAEDPAARSALKMMLRPYVAPNLCSSCHGFDGLRRFLYFHSTKDDLRHAGRTAASE
jgi:hypothetical protein